MDQEAYALLHGALGVLRTKKHFRPASGGLDMGGQFLRFHVLGIVRGFHPQQAFGLFPRHDALEIRFDAEPVLRHEAGFDFAPANFLCGRWRQLHLRNPVKKRHRARSFGAVHIPLDFVGGVHRSRWIVHAFRADIVLLLLEGFVNLALAVNGRKLR